MLACEKPPSYIMGSTPLISTSLLFFLTLSLVHTTKSSPPENPVHCVSGTTDCTITNSYGTFPDRATCRAAKVVYPTSEKELVALVAKATRAGQKMKVATRYSHSIPKLACPGGDDGLIISTRDLNRVASIDSENMMMVVESGVVLKDLIDVAAKAGLALPYAPYWWGVTVGGMMGTGAHGSSLWGKGSAVHEYVVSVRIVTPGTESEGYAKVREVGEEDSGDQLDAVRVSLGVLGVISRVTFKLQPLFKRSITYTEQHDTELSDTALTFGERHEFADIKWYPSHHKAVYREDDRVPIDTPGDGLYDIYAFRPTPIAETWSTRIAEETMDNLRFAEGKCLIAGSAHHILLKTFKFGLTNDGFKFTGYPVIGFQNRMQSAGGCLTGHEDHLFISTSCPWDHRHKHSLFMHQTAISIGLSKVKNFILDVQKLRDLEPKALCGLEIYDGILMRYVKASSAYMGKVEDSIDFDFTYYRSHDPTAPRLYEDVMEEIEQMAVFKYGGLPHWGKNRNVAFKGVIDKYAKKKEFLKVKNVYDPEGLFSNEWTDQILGIKGTTSIVREGCALEGLCICSDDIHCAPEKGYFCRPGRVYKDARVCFHKKSWLAQLEQNSYDYHDEL